MTWLAWRQFRAQAIVAAACLAVLAAFFLDTGRHLAHLYATSGLPGCRSTASCANLTTQFFNDAKQDPFNPVLFFTGFGLLILLPAVVGIFWGAPLVSRELETGTFKLAWNQDVTRTRWTLVKLGLVGLAAMATAGLLSLLFTWWVSPIDKAGGFPDNMSQLSRLSPQMFIDRGIAPVGWAAFAFVLGVTAGVLIRRAIPAMAVTLVVVALVQILWPALVRPHLLTPRVATAPVTALAVDNDMLMMHNGEMSISVNQAGSPLRLPGAWIMSNKTVTPAGQVFVLPNVPACQAGFYGQQKCNAWIASQHLRQQVSYLPASSFWPLQWYETTILLVLAVGLGGLCIWQVRRLLT